jgi:hypothetical protein
MFWDGCTVTKLKNHSNTPVMFVNLNLKPEMRYKSEHMLMACLIPGPSKYKDFDSFLRPIIDELKLLGQGIPGVYNSFDQQYFTLRAWVMFCSCDGPARAEGNGLASPGNAKRPCHSCWIHGETMGGRIYYVPHKPRDLIALRPRENLRQMIDKWAILQPETVRKEQGTQYGIFRKSILLELSSLHFPRSFPLDLMHCVLQNIVTNYHKLWVGNRFEEDDPKKAKQQATQLARENTTMSQQGPQIDILHTEGVPDSQRKQEEYVISEAKWHEVGFVQEQSRRTIPRLLGQGPRSIDKHWRGYKAMEWEAWLVRDSLPLLYTIPNFEKYLQNFMELRSIYLRATSWVITPEDIDYIRFACKHWLETYEQLYFRDDPARVKVCLVNYHSLLHLGKLTLNYYIETNYI